MIEVAVYVTAALLVGGALGILVAYLVTDKAMARLTTHANATDRLNAELNTELDRVTFSLGGRLRDAESPPVYLLPPPYDEKTNSCDVARIAWLDAAKTGADALRVVGLDEIADRVYPATAMADQAIVKRSDPNAPAAVKERPL